MHHYWQLLYRLEKKVSNNTHAGEESQTGKIVIGLLAHLHLNIAIPEFTTDKTWCPWQR